MWLPLVLKLGGRDFWQIKDEERHSGKQMQRGQDKQFHKLGKSVYHQPKNKKG